MQVATAQRMTGWIDEAHGRRQALVAYFAADVADAAMTSIDSAVCAWGPPERYTGPSDTTFLTLTFVTVQGLCLQAQFPPDYPLRTSLQFDLCMTEPAATDDDDAGMFGSAGRSWWDLPKLAAELREVVASFAGQDQLLPALNACNLAGCRFGSIVYEDTPSASQQWAPPDEPLVAASTPADVAASPGASAGSDPVVPAAVDGGDPPVYAMVYHTWGAVCLFLGPRDLARLSRVNRFLYDVATDDAVWEHGWRSKATNQAARQGGKPLELAWPVDLWEDTTHSDHESWGAPARPMKAIDASGWEFAPPRADVDKPPPLPWSYRWSYAVAAAAAAVPPVPHVRGEMSKTVEGGHFITMERRYQGTLATAWRWLWVHTSNPFARAWARIMANYESCNANTALRLFLEFPFHRIRRRLAACLGMPMSKVDLLRLRSKISDRSLDNDEHREVDVTTIPSMVVKTRDVRLMGSDGSTTVLSDVSIVDPITGLPMLVGAAASSATAAGVGTPPPLSPQAAVEAAWSAANDAPVLVMRRSDDPRAERKVKLQISARADAIAALNRNRSSAAAAPP